MNLQNWRFFWNAQRLLMRLQDCKIAKLQNCKIVEKPLLKCISGSLIAVTLMAKRASWDLFQKLSSNKSKSDESNPLLQHNNQLRCHSFTDNQCKLQTHTIWQLDNSRIVGANFCGQKCNFLCFLHDIDDTWTALRRGLDSLDLERRLRLKITVWTSLGS